MKPAFTLVETLLYLGLFAVFILVVSAVFLSVLDVQIASEGTSGISQDGRYLLARLEHDIHRSTAVVAPALPGQSSPQLMLEIGGVTYSYSQIGGNLWLTDAVAPVRLNSFDTQVSNLIFNRVGDTIKASFTVSSLEVPSSGVSPSQNFHITVGLL